MKRTWPWLALVLAGMLAITGCPPGDGGDDGGDGDAPPGDPDNPVQPFLSINATASFVQAAGQAFNRESDLQAVLSSGTATQVTWAIEVNGSAEQVLFFLNDDNTFSPTASGASVTVAPNAAPPQDVSHDVIATATLSDGSTLTARIEIVVADDPIAGGESTVLSVAPFPDPAVGFDANRRVSIDSGATGAANNQIVAFEWNLVDDTLADLVEAGRVTLGPTDEETLTVTFAEDVQGVFPFRVTVTDALENVATGIAYVYIGLVDQTVDVRAIRARLSPGSDITVRSIRAGGATDLETSSDESFIYFWQVLQDVDGVNTDISDTATIDPPSGSTLDAEVIDWDFSGLGEGSYRFILTVRDRAGSEAIGSAQLALSDELALTAQAQHPRVGTDTAFMVRTARSGGELPFRYSFSVIDEDGNDVSGDTTLPADNTQFNGTTNDWDISGFSTAGTYRVFVTVVDGAGNSNTTSTSIAVGDALSLDVKANKVQVSPGDPTPVTFTFDVNGGTTPFTYTYSISRSPGTTGAIAVVPASPEAAAGDLGVTWAVPAAAAGATGTYRMDVTVTDDLGNTAIDSLAIEVGAAGGGAQVDLQTARLEFAPSTTHTNVLRSFRNGGVGPFAYAWEVLAPNGTDVTASFGGGPGPTTADSLAGQEIEWTATVGAVTPGTYRLRLIMTDNGAGGAETSDSVEILVADILTVDLRPRASVVAPNVPIELVADGNGGLGTYDFAFAVVDAEGDAAGTLSAAAVNNAATGTVIWAAPANGSGSYRATVTCTDDALGTTAIMTVPIFVNSDTVVADSIIDPPTPQTDLSAGGVDGVFDDDINFEAIGGAADAALTIVPDNVDPGLANARSITFRFVDNNAGGELDVTEVEFVGTNQRGEPVVARSPNPAIGTTVELTVGFKTLQRITINYTGAEANDDLEVGIGQWVGLSAPFSAVSQAVADRKFHIVATGNTLDTTPATATFLNPEANAAFELDFAPPDSQLCRFPGTPPNGTRDFVVQFEPFTAMTVDVLADLNDLDVSNGDVATLLFDVSGGQGPYDFVYEDLGALGGTNTVDNNFGLASPQTRNFDLVTAFTPPAVAGVETHAIRVQVTDANSNVAVGHTLLIVRP